MAQESGKPDVEESSREEEPPSVISAGLRIVGDVVSGGVVHIEGEVDGDIRCAKLMIGAEGRVKGQVTAATVVVHGNMAGTIRAQHVRLARSATVEGEVIHEQLTVEAGARLDGYYRPVEHLDVVAAADARRQPGRARRAEPDAPRRPLSPFRKAPRSAMSLRQFQGLTPKPLH
jgi:cytoskeletal protein CcmA (bactofilin family)